MFRKLCGVKKNEPWPLTNETRIDKASGEPFYTPDFDSDVSDPTNADLFEKVGRLVMADLKVSCYGAADQDYEAVGFINV